MEWLAPQSAALSSQFSPVVIALPERLHPGFLEAVREVSPRVETIAISNEAPLPHEIEDATVFYRSYVFSREVTDEVIARARDLQWMHIPADGVDLVLTPSVLEADFIITHMGETYDVPVAEFALSLLMAAAKCLPAYVRAQQEHRWHRGASWDEVNQERTLPRIVRGQTIGIVGFGGIGGRLAELVQPLGMRVLGLRRDPHADPRAERMYGTDELLEMLPECDYVVLTMPLTPATERLFGAEQIAAMKPSSHLVNVSRGALIDDGALIAALESERIAGACLDVFSTEPLPSDSPYYRLPNVILTPHVAGAFPNLNVADRDVFVGLLQRFVNGEPLRMIVDRERGY